MTTVQKFVLVWLVALVLSEGVESCCPYKWRQFGESCYFIRMELNTWKVSQELCQYEGGYLAQVETAAEDQFLRDTFQGLYPIIPSDELLPNAFYVGGYDADGDGKFRWENSQSSVEFPAWAPGEPSNVGSEICLEYKYYKTGFFGNDMMCDRPRYSVCEKPAKK